MYFVYVHHLYGNTHEIVSLKSESECEEFVFRHHDPEVHRLRIFYGEELKWVPRDIVKSVRLEPLRKPDET